LSGFRDEFDRNACRYPPFAAEIAKCPLSNVFQSETSNEPEKEVQQIYLPEVFGFLIRGFFLAGSASDGLFRLM